MWCGAPLAGRAALTWKVLVAVHPANLWNNMCQGIFRWAQGQNHLDFFHVFTTITGDDEMMHHFKTGWEYYFDNSKSHDFLVSKYLRRYCFNRIEHELFARCFGQNIQILLRSLLLQTTAPSDHWNHFIPNVNNINLFRCWPARRTLYTKKQSWRVLSFFHFDMNLYNFCFFPPNLTA